MSTFRKSIANVGAAIIAAVMIAALASADDLATEYVPPDCGPTALYLLLHFFGNPADLSTVESALPSSNHSMAEIQRAAASRGVALEGREHGPDRPPPDRVSIAYMKTNGVGHYIVLRPVGVLGTMVQVIDPPRPPRVMDYDRLVSNPSWTGRLLVPLTMAERLRTPLLALLSLTLAIVLILRLRRFRRRATRPT